MFVISSMRIAKEFAIPYISEYWLAVMEYEKLGVIAINIRSFMHVPIDLSAIANKKTYT